MTEKGIYKKETAGELATTRVPTAHPETTVEKARKLIEKDSWEDSDTIYLVTEEDIFVGEVPIARIISAKDTDLLEKFVTKPKITLPPHIDQEKVVIEVVKNDIETVPIVNHDKNFLGVITARRIIDVLHDEHLEDFLRFTGIRGRGSSIIDLFKTRIIQVVGVRLPWLLIGLGVGFGITLLTSGFETSLRENITLVYFIPIMAYMSDAIGTQSETIFIRSITLFKINIFSYFIREFLTGAIIGSVIGFCTGIFAYILSGSIPIGFVVGISLGLSMTLATILACTTPLALKALGKDPAVGSGPFTTAIQDFMSLLIYLLIATIVLQNV